MNPGDDRRVRLDLHYDGTEFLGWQIQPEGRTVQGVLQEALQRLTGAPRSVLGSGRTDRGVHATGQVAAVTVPQRWSADELRRALNAVLPPDVWVAAALEVDPAFHPRYDALSREYQYRVGLGPEASSPFHRRWCWVLSAFVDVDLLRASAAELEGEHGFGAFAKAGQPERGERCRVLSAAWHPWDELGLLFRIVADRFLHHMVRYLVGTMVDIARGRRPLEDLRALLSPEREGLLTSPPAPPEGLCLTRITYRQEAAST